MRFAEDEERGLARLGLRVAWQCTRARRRQMVVGDDREHRHQHRRREERGREPEGGVRVAERMKDGCVPEGDDFEEDVVGRQRIRLQAPRTHARRDDHRHQRSRLKNHAKHQPPYRTEPRLTHRQCRLIPGPVSQPA